MKENILTLNNNQNILSQEEIESLFKGFIKLIEKNTEQKIKNMCNLNFEEERKIIKKTNLPILSVNTVKDLEELKNMALKIFDENARLKKEIVKLNNKVVQLRSTLVKDC